MKNSQILFILLFLLMCAQGFGQKIKKTDKVTALKLKKAIAQQYQNRIRIQAFNVDKYGVLRPNKGYEIVYLPKEKNFFVKPQNTENPPIDGVVATKVPGGTLICHCGFGAGDDCKYNTTLDGNIIRYFCDGSCGCGDVFVPDRGGPIEYETVGGTWNEIPYSG